MFGDAIKRVKKVIRREKESEVKDGDTSLFMRKRQERLSSSSPCISFFLEKRSCLE
jgi:hypothetical protein